MANKLRAIALAATAALVAADWEIIASNVGTISTGISFSTNSTGTVVGYLPVSINGQGTEILQSTDGGKTWGNPGTEPFALLLLDIASFKDNVGVVGALEMLYSTDGGVIYNSSLAQPGAGQCIRTIGPMGSEIGFGAVGQWGLLSEANGVEVSYDGGAVFKTINTTLTASARYGAFPDDKTWFIAAGDWPGEGSDDTGGSTSGSGSGSSSGSGSEQLPMFSAVGKTVNPAHYATAVEAGSKLLKARAARLHLLQAPSGAVSWAVVKPEAQLAANVRGNVGNQTTWDAQIATTTDAGTTWNVVFSRVGQFYLNGIECYNTTQCCSVGETGAGGAVGGSYIWCTNDGGNTWAETLVDNDPNSSLIDIAAVSDSVFVAVGGEFGSFGPTAAHFYMSTDGGVTWNLDNRTTIVDEYAIDIDCEGGNCWSNLLDLLTQETSIASMNQ